MPLFGPRTVEIGDSVWNVVINMTYYNQSPEPLSYYPVLVPALQSQYNIVERTDVDTIRWTDRWQTGIIWRNF
jgi:hypothetical protein